MKRILFLALLLAGFVTGHAQQRVERILKKSDTCLCLAAMADLKTTSFSSINKWALLDAFDCIEKEWLILTPGPNWISMPRLSANATTNRKEANEANEVFHRERFDAPYEALRYDHYRTFKNGGSPYSAINEHSWDFAPYDEDNTRIFSYRGYILYLKSNRKNKLLLRGNIKKPATTFPLYKNKTNWIGYFLPFEQNVFDALKGHLDNIIEIRHRDYYCFKESDKKPKSNWICSDSITHIRYGEMIKVWPTKDDTLFQWHQDANTRADTVKAGRLTFQYKEQANYKPIIIALKNNCDCKELGVFVDSVCLGAVPVNKSDTLVILRAYLNGKYPGILHFKSVERNAASTIDSVPGYWVLDEDITMFRKRNLHTTEGSRKAFVSFEKEPNRKLFSSINFKLWPATVDGLLNYSFNLYTKALVELSVFNVDGKLLDTPVKERMAAGSIIGKLDFYKFSNGKTKPGIYLVKFKAGQILETKKVIVK